MPTGYTATLAEGEQTFQDFALGCARAFGALITMRDEPIGAPIPDEFSPSDYHLKRIESGEVELARLEAMTAEEVALDAHESNSREDAAWLQRQADKVRQRDRYKAMLATVVQWQAPETHAEFKKFMVEQLQESIRFDCPDDDGKEWDKRPEPMKPDDWLSMKLAGQRRMLARDREEHAKECKRAADRTAWVQDLKKALAL